jgi:transposase-like protein
MWSNGYYYLVAQLGKRYTPANLRLDRITDIVAVNPTPEMIEDYKLKINNGLIFEHISLAKEYDADKSMICRWIRNYNQYGEVAFDSKNHRKGNPFSALHTSKSITETDRLHLQLAKLEIENERLKKGYLAKGVGANKVFVTLKDVNMK